LAKGSFGVQMISTVGSKKNTVVDCDFGNLIKSLQQISLWLKNFFRPTEFSKTSPLCFLKIFYSGTGFSFAVVDECAVFPIKWLIFSSKSVIQPSKRKRRA